MYRKLLIILICSLYLMGCDELNKNKKDGLPDLFFKNEYILSDFNLNANYLYWEIRRGALPGQDVSTYEVIAKYDDVSYSHLDSTQIQIINATSSQNGFAGQCLPSYCPIYAVALIDYDVSIIDSVSKLKAFFGEIDTEAELFILLSYAQDYALSTEPETYEETDYGYLVVLKWDTLCQLRGKDLVKVYRDGTIEKIKEISRETYSGCA